MTDREFVFAAPILDRGSELLPREVRKALQVWFDSFENDEFADDASNVSLDAWAVSHQAVIDHIDELAARLDRVLAELYAIHSADLADVQMAEEVLERLRKGEGQTYSDEEIRAHLGLDN
jgi:predicted DNA-binding protein